MSAIRWKRTAAFVVGTAFIVLSLGCSSNPPCEVDISVVDAARSEAARAQREVDNAQSQVSDLQSQLDAEKARKADLERRKAELLAQIKELEGGE